jgi:DNA-3-methyladenine glycosylase
VTVRALLSGHAADVAPLLLGATVTSRVDGRTVAVRLTEVEAYGGVGEDPGSHAFRRRTARTASMFGPAGHAYVYFTYGMHWCLNVVTGEPGEAGAVLLRAGEVVVGADVARDRRRRADRDRDLARGPARLATALGVTGALDGVDLLARRGPLRLALPAAAATAVVVTARTGVSGAGAGTPWRFHLPAEPSVSPYRPASRRT